MNATASTPSNMVDLAPFFMHPVNALIVVLIALVLGAKLINELGPAWDRLFRGFKRNAGEAPAQPLAAGAVALQTVHTCSAIHKDLNAQREEAFNLLRQVDEKNREEIRADIVGIHRRIDGVQAQITAMGERYTEQLTELGRTLTGQVSELSGQILQMNIHYSRKPQ
jgi:Sec-independent protein translocase protein TatA